LDTHCCPASPATQRPLDRRQRDVHHRSRRAAADPRAEDARDRASTRLICSSLRTAIDQPYCRARRSRPAPATLVCACRASLRGRCNFRPTALADPGVPPWHPSPTIDSCAICVFTTSQPPAPQRAASVDLDGPATQPHRHADVAQLLGRAERRTATCPVVVHAARCRRSRARARQPAAIAHRPAALVRAAAPRACPSARRAERIERQAANEAQFSGGHGAPPALRCSRSSGISPATSRLTHRSETVEQLGVAEQLLVHHVEVDAFQAERRVIQRLAAPRSRRSSAAGGRCTGSPRRRSCSARGLCCRERRRPGGGSFAACRSRAPLR